MSSTTERSPAGHRAAHDRDYRPGHTVHWIQAKKAAADRDGREHGHIVEATEQQVVVRFDDGSRRSYRHGNARLPTLTTQQGRRVTVQERWSLLQLGRHLISIARTTGA